MLIVFGMPYLMDNSMYSHSIQLHPSIFRRMKTDRLGLVVDPEMRAEFEERSKSSPLSGALAGSQSGQNPLQNFDPAAWLAGSGNSKNDAPAAGARAKEVGVSR